MGLRRIYFIKQIITRSYLCDFVEDDPSKPLEREYIRRDLERGVIDITQEDIYCYENDKVIKVAEDVKPFPLSADAKLQLVVYSKDVREQEKFDIQDIQDTGELRQWIMAQQMDLTNAQNYCMVGDQLIQIDKELRLNVMNASADRKYIVGEKRIDEDLAAYLYEIKDGTLIEKEELTKYYDGSVWMDDVLCYYEYSPTDRENHENDGLYIYKNDKSKKIADHVASMNAYMSEGNIIYFNDIELQVYRKDDTSRCIDSNVVEFVCTSTKDSEE